MSALKRLKADFEVKFASNAPEGTFSGYASIFDYEDFGGDVIQKGAFAASLREWKSKNKMPKMLLQHGGGFFGGSAEDMLPIGVWADLYEDSKGLYAEGRLIALDTDKGKTIYAGLKEGGLDGLSIGYRAKEFTLGTKTGEPPRLIKKADLMEVSVVLFGMNDRALIEDVKNIETEIDGLNSLSDVESLLREACGFSRKNATALVSRMARITQREAGSTKSMSGLLEQMRSITQLTTSN